MNARDNVQTVLERLTQHPRVIRRSRTKYTLVCRKCPPEANVFVNGQRRFKGRLIDLCPKHASVERHLRWQRNAIRKNGWQAEKLRAARRVSDHRRRGKARAQRNAYEAKRRRDKTARRSQEWLALVAEVSSRVPVEVF